MRLRALRSGWPIGRPGPLWFEKGYCHLPVLNVQSRATPRMSTLNLNASFGLSARGGGSGPLYRRSLSPDWRLTGSPSIFKSHEG